MTKKKQKRAAAPLLSAREVRPSVWPLRATSVVLTLLGVIPMANLITTGAGLPWWTDAMKQWAVWLTVIISSALAIGYAAPALVEDAFARGERALLALPRRAFALLVAALTCGLAVYFGYRMFELHPVAGDEFAQRWQSSLLAAGRLSARPELLHEFFSTSESLVVYDRWFSQFPMGGPAILALGAVAGVPWLVNPLLAGFAAALFYVFARATTDELTGRIAALLFAASPFVLFMAGSQMNHVSTLALVLVALAAMPTWLASERGLWPSAAIGASLGIAATIRPFDAAVVALVIGIFQLREALRERRRFRSLAVQCAVGAVPVLLLLAANWATVGDPFIFAYDALNGAQHRPGFHATPLGFDHTPRRGLYMASAYLMKLDVGLFAWPAPAVLIVALTLVLQRRATSWDHLHAALLLAVLLGYAVYWSESYFVGPRFLFVSVPAFVLFTARFPFALGERLSSPHQRAATKVLVPLWLIVAWAAPPMDGRLFGVRELVRLYRMHPTAPAVLGAIRDAHLANALVFVPDGWHARLTARVRALGVRPLIAETLVSGHDACALQEALNAAERVDEVEPGRRAQLVFDAMERLPPAAKLSGLPPVEQISLIPGRPSSAECRAEFEGTLSYGLNLAELLPYVELDPEGRLGGHGVFARDCGPRNERLRGRFGKRAWYVARAAMEKGQLKVKLEQR